MEPPLSKFHFLWLGFLADFVILAIPCELLTSVLSDFSLEIFITLTVTSIILTFTNQHMKIMITSNRISELLQTPVPSTLPFIANFRAIALLSTTFLILAVDFVLFPRRFAKAETYGTGLMDVGVGSYMIANAIVSPEARGKELTHSPVVTIVKSMRASVPLLLLGIGRVIATKGVDYHEHVAEYGTHWNFFFTLAVVKVLSTVIFSCLHERLWTVVGALVLIAYQYSLSSGLAEYIIMGYDGKGGHHGILDANREGICSCLGYLGLYLISIKVGKYLMKPRKLAKDWFEAVVVMTTLTVLSIIMMYAAQIFIQPVSRRMANLSYALWMMVVNFLILTVLMLFDVVTILMKKSKLQGTEDVDVDNQQKEIQSESEETSQLLAAINYNGLFYFLLANVQTGLVNLSIKTLLPNPYQTVSPISMAKLSSVHTGIDVEDIKGFRNQKVDIKVKMLKKLGGDLYPYSCESPLSLLENFTPSTVNYP
ncbi:hypothetical protein CHS0354_026462 [Potamilus streckersoni]|uniref:Phosphatidylinositol-glycan biosynthesis class W protein n=1 Tax=Potamilus streckersoni TaxID=2493646 RepID=A0AAE0RQ14_9BIVA|nr:hypothetical protein CHS0354_026462 [Potamilus streckersoni]